MSKPRILVQLDTDDQPSVFDSIVAIDAGAEHVLRHASITVANVRDRVHGAIFTRGPDELRSTAIFVGGSDVAAGEAVLEAVRGAFFGPLRVSVMLDPAGANTTAAAAVLTAARHLGLAGATALVLAATGPVGQRVVRLLAREGAAVRVASRSVERASAVCQAVSKALGEGGVGARLSPHATASPDEAHRALEGAEMVIAAGAPGVELVSAEARARATALKVAIDLNAVPPAGLEGVNVTDRATAQGNVLCYGAIGVGATKMRIHKAAIRRLFEANDLVLDAEQLFELGRSLQ